MWRTRVIFPLIGPLGGVVVLACRFAGGFGGVRASYGNVLLKRFLRFWGSVFTACSALFPGGGCFDIGLLEIPCGDLAGLGHFSIGGCFILRRHLFPCGFSGVSGVSGFSNFR